MSVRPKPARLRSAPRPFALCVAEDRSRDITPPRDRIYSKRAEANIVTANRSTSARISDYELRGGAVVNVHIRHQDFGVGAEFSTPMMTEHLDELIDMLIAVRERARLEGILR
jgi:hypothetical protein